MKEEHDIRTIAGGHSELRHLSIDSICIKCGRIPTKILGIEFWGDCHPLPSDQVNEIIAKRQGFQNNQQKKEFINDWCGSFLYRKKPDMARWKGIIPWWS
ncbi:MAG: hypothetical protein PVF58_14210 [Candidatus Methanofastidiosia archaeon]|jgi:hypothetical protein